MHSHVCLLIHVYTRSEPRLYDTQVMNVAGLAGILTLLNGAYTFYDAVVVKGLDPGSAATSVGEYISLSYPVL